jgi:hypothetical protein
MKKRKLKKKKVRARMERTGEQYQAAHSRLTRASPTPPPSPPGDGGGNGGGGGGDDGLPPTLEGLLDQLRRGEITFMQVADMLGGSEECEICGTPMLDDYALVEGIAQRYGVAAEQEVALTETILAMVGRTHTESVWLTDGATCSRCADNIAPDDESDDDES